MIDFDDLTKEEQAFRKLLSDPCEFSKWATEARKAWAKTAAGLLAERRNGERNNERRK